MKPENTQKKRKICVLSLNRSEYSRIRSVIRALLEREDIELSMVVLNSKYANNKVLLEKDGFPIHRIVNISIDERSPYKTAKAIGEVVDKFAAVFNEEKPDMLLVLGDRYEALGAVTAASFQNIYIAHIQGGEVSGTLDEHTRHAITKLSHLHFPSTELSKERVIKMGELAENVYNVGCPGTDSLLASPEMSFEELRYEMYRHAGNRRDILEKLLPGFLLVLQFPVATEVEHAEFQIQETLKALARSDRTKVILTPTPDAGGDIVERELRAYAERDPKAMVLKHVPAELFANILRHASMMIGNSSAGIRETGYFGLPTLNIGSRQTGRERSSNVFDVPHDADIIAEMIAFHLAHGPYALEAVYGDGTAGKKIAEIVAVADITKIQKRLTY